MAAALTLRADASTVEMPAVFVEPLPLDALNTKVTWSMAEGQPLVRVESLSFSNAHLEGTFAGTYQAQAQGPGRIDLAGGLTRVEGAQAWRYVPLVVHHDVRSWLQAAIVAGQLHSVRVTLRGELQRFPFDDGTSGVFEVVAGIRNGSLAYAPRWPVLEDISGQLVVRGHRLSIDIASARVFGARIGPATRCFPDLGSHEPVLEVRGEGEGSSADFLRFLAESPIEGGAGGVQPQRAGERPRPPGAVPRGSAQALHRYSGLGTLPLHRQRSARRCGRSAPGTAGRCACPSPATK